MNYAAEYRVDVGGSGLTATEIRNAIEESESLELTSLIRLIPVLLIA